MENEEWRVEEEGRGRGVEGELTALLCSYQKLEASSHQLSLPANSF